MGDQWLNDRWVLAIIRISDFISMISARGVNSSENQIHSYKFQTFYFISLFQTFWVSLLGRFINLLFSSCFLFFTRNLLLSSSKSSFSSTNILCSTRDLALLKPPEKSSSTFCRRRLFRLSSDLLRAFKVLLSHQDPKFHNVKSFTKIVWKKIKVLRPNQMVIILKSFEICIYLWQRQHRNWIQSK